MVWRKEKTASVVELCGRALTNDFGAWTKQEQCTGGYILTHLFLNVKNVMEKKRIYEQNHQSVSKPLGFKRGTLKGFKEHLLRHETFSKCFYLQCGSTLCYQVPTG